VDAASPHDPVHLVGHDWGSVECWDAVLRWQSDPDRRGRVASFTSISGPCLDHVGRWARRRLRGTWRERRLVLSQTRRSWYVYAFQVPRLPEWALSRVDIARLLARGEQIERWHGDTLADDARLGLNLYRANLRGRERVPGGLSTDLPVQLVVPTRDQFLSPAVYADLPRYVSDLARVDIDARHWVVRSHPDRVAASIRSFVRLHA
jgi:pimeloyl-ACP methyl ester carboxylesterase